MPADAPPLLRRARPGEAAAITAMMLRSKRSWGYSDEFMSTVASDMTLAPASIETDIVEVLEQAGAIVGVMRLQRRASCAWLQDLFVDPDSMGQGLGRRLFDRAVALSRVWGYHEMQFESDPNAESFYLRLGAERIGTSLSGIIPGRQFPLLRYAL